MEDLGTLKAILERLLESSGERSRAAHEEPYRGEVVLVDDRVLREGEGHRRDDERDRRLVPLDGFAELDEVELGHEDDGAAVREGLVEEDDESKDVAPALGQSQLRGPRARSSGRTEGGSREQSQADQTGPSPRSAAG